MADNLGMSKNTIPTVTMKHIEQLRQEATVAGDERLVAICDRALAGSGRAFDAAAKVIRTRRTEAAYQAMRETAKVNAEKDKA
jgi:hypothetical protein